MQPNPHVPKGPDRSIGLLVSVRSAFEAQAALAGGASLIDIKEPSRGSLGRADDETITAIVNAVHGERPVSAAQGEWIEGVRESSLSGLSYIKWGLAGCGRRRDWRTTMASLLRGSTSPQVVLTAYADWECAQAPAVDEVFRLAAEYPGSVMLVDTHCKTPAKKHQKRPTLLDWITVAAIEELCERCRESKVQIALAGSLGLDEIRALRSARPDWFAVRGAVCADGDRLAAVDAGKVRELLEVIKCPLQN